jgi:hypothetical protein
MARMIPPRLAPNALLRPRAPVTSLLLNGDSVPPDDDGAADSSGAEAEAHGDQEHGQGDEGQGSQGDVEEGQDGQDQGDDVENQAEHGLNVPAVRPFDLAQLKEGLTRWVDRLGTFDDQAVGLHQVLEATGALADARGELVDKLVDNYPRNERGNRVPWVETPVGILKKDRSGGSSNWDAEMIWPDLLAEARRRAAQANGGELTPEAEAGAQAMLAVLKEVLSSPSFRVRALEKLGIDPDEVRATTPSRTIVRFA